MIEQILGFDPFHDPYAAARAFYGEQLFQVMLAQQRKQAEEARIKAEAAHRLIDDVAGQVKR